MVKFEPGVMREKFGRGDTYVSPRHPVSPLPRAKFLLNTVRGPLLWLWHMGKNGRCDDFAWNYGSAWLADIFENVGCRLMVEGLTQLDKLHTPCVFIANHMSALETFVLPAMIRPRRPVTYVVKRSLTAMPVFGVIMRSRNPVVVDRASPREDLKVVLEEGAKRLEEGVSIIVFPQHTRSLQFDQGKFNSIGVKLAARAGVPALPVALKTDAWGQGKFVKELGKVDPSRPARFRFGEPMTITGKGKEQHAQICHFIQENLDAWQKTDGMNL